MDAKSFTLLKLNKREKTTEKYKHMKISKAFMPVYLSILDALIIRMRI